MAWQPRDRIAEALAEVFGSGAEPETSNGHPQVELTAGGMAFEAAIPTLVQMHGERATTGLRAMNGTGAAQTWAGASGGLEAQQVQDLLDRDLHAHRSQID